ncbi:hypothetical protein Goari_000522 [Gossypium aridum]|uniref:RNase H type-1 domain-containing protein n=1 Tax=Gossypium aridum TaxID=34290 RepID=A0A7J8YGY3_GOSAI|nr:hypothetical protein [Gossypium aridum]
MAVCTYPCENISDLTMVEAKACLQDVTMAEEIGKFAFQIVPRGANKATHRLALKGRRFEGPRYWMEEVPHAVEGLVNRDRSSDDDGG